MVNSLYEFGLQYGQGDNKYSWIYRFLRKKWFWVCCKAMDSFFI